MSTGIALGMDQSVTEVAAAPQAITQTPLKPRLWTVFATWLVAALVGQICVIAACFVIGLGVGVVKAVQGADQAAIQQAAQQVFQLPLVAMLVSIVPFQVGAALVVLLAARQSNEPLRERLGLVPQPERELGASKAAMLACFTLSTALGFALAASMMFGGLPTNSLTTTMTDGSWLAVMLVGVVLSLIPAVVEEVVFRGYIQRRLLQRWSPTVAIGVSTLLFAILHLDSWQHIVAVIPLGIVTGIAAQRTGSVKSGVLIHAIHNAGAVGFAALARVLTPLIGEEPTGVVVIGVVLAMGAVGLWGIISLRRTLPTPATATPAVLPQPAV